MFLSFLTVDASPAASSSCRQALLTVTDCTLKLCAGTGPPFLQLHLPGILSQQQDVTDTSSMCEVQSPAM